MKWVDHMMTSDIKPKDIQFTVRGGKKQGNLHI